MAGERKTVLTEFKAVDEVSKVLAQLGKATAAANDELKRYQRDAVTGFDRVQRAALRFVRLVTAPLRGLASILRSAVLPHVLALVAAFAGFQVLRGAVTDAREFGSAMAEVSTLFTGTDEQLASLRDTVVDLSRELNQNEAIVARGAYETLSRHSSDAAEATDFLTASVRLAAGGFADVDEVVKVLAGSMVNFGDQVRDVRDLADLFFVTVQFGGTTIPELAASLAQVAPTAKNLGISIEEVTAALAAMTSAGTPTSQAITQLRSLLNAMIRTQEQVNEALQGTGLRFDEQTIRAEGLVGALERLQQASGGTATGLQELGISDEALTASLGLLNTGLDNFLEKLALVQDRSGAVETALERRFAEPAEAAARAFNSLRLSLVQAFGEPVLARAAQFFADAERSEAVLLAVEIAGQGAAEVFDLLAAALEEGSDAFIRFIDSIGGVDQVAELASLAIEAFGDRAEVVVRRVIFEVTRLAGAVQVLPLAFQVAAQEIRDGLRSAGLDSLFGLEESLPERLARLRRELESIEGSADPFDFTQTIAIDELQSQIRALEAAGVQVAEVTAKAFAQALAEATSQELPKSIADAEAQAQASLERLRERFADFRASQRGDRNVGAIGGPLGLGDVAGQSIIAIQAAVAVELERRAAAERALTDEIERRALAEAQAQRLATDALATEREIVDLINAVRIPSEQDLIDQEKLYFDRLIDRIDAEALANAEFGKRAEALRELIRLTQRHNEEQRKSTRELRESRAIAEQFVDVLDQRLAAGLTQIALYFGESEDAARRFGIALIEQFTQIIIQELIVIELTKQLRALLAALNLIGSAASSSGGGGGGGGGQLGLGDLDLGPGTGGSGSAPSTAIFRPGFSDRGSIARQSVLSEGRGGPGFSSRGGIAGFDPSELGGQGSRAGGTTINQSVNVNLGLSAIDGRSAAQFLNEHGETIVALVTQAVDGANRGLIDSLRSKVGRG